MQGMCDLVAPLLVIFDDEALTYGCFCKLMERMIENFPNGGAMDMHFANMRYDLQHFLIHLKVYRLETLVTRSYFQFFIFSIFFIEGPLYKFWIPKCMI